MNSFKLRIISIIMAVIYLSCINVVFAVEPGSNFAINNGVSGKLRIGVENLRMEIYKFDGMEMIQLRSLADKYGWNLRFDSMSKVILISKGKHSFIISAVNGQQFNIRPYNVRQNDSGDVIKIGPGNNNGQIYPVIRDGRTYLPIKILNDILNEFEEDSLLTGLYIDRIGDMVDGKIIAHIRLYNLSQGNIKLNFSSGQRYDLYLQKDDQEIWRWSDGRFFTMALAQLGVKPGESLEYDVELPGDLEAGKYILSGKLTTVPTPLELNEVIVEIYED